MITAHDLTNRAVTPSPEPIVRTCRACGQVFTIDADEQRWFADLAARTGQAWQLPGRCFPCRKAARDAMLATVDDGQDEWLVCVDCNDVFQFGGRDRAYFASRGFAKPKRCRPCRQVGPRRG
jgi:hypothetical protein